jgi:hypothetical protein
VSKKQVVVVIPIYKAELTSSERVSLQQCISVLANYPLVIVKPDQLNIKSLLKEFPSLQSKSFQNHYFEDIAGYNQLMISTDFYKSFSNYEYMLIYQLDAFVFKDKLLEWCRSGYDYIGAPGLESESLFKLQATDTEQLTEALSTQHPVLNGGLSLRSTSAMIRYLRIYKLFFPKWVGNEDKLFSLDARRLAPMRFFIKLPHWETALQFSFEKSPAASFELNAQELPFGCHAWEKYDPEFWKSFIPCKNAI